MTEAEFLFKRREELEKLRDQYYEDLNAEWNCIYSYCNSIDDMYSDVDAQLEEESSGYPTIYDIEASGFYEKYPWCSFKEPMRFILFLGVEKYNEYITAKEKANAEFKEFKEKTKKEYAKKRKEVEDKYSRILDNDRELKKKIDEYNNILKELGVDDDERLEPLVKAGVDRYDLKYTFARLEGGKLIKKTEFGYEFIDDEDNHKVAAFVICANYKWNLVTDKPGETERYNYDPFNKIFTLQKGTLKSKSRSVHNTYKNFEKYFK